MRNIKGVVITIAFLVIGVVCRSQTLEKIFTIDQAVDRVMQNYPSIDQAEEAIKRAEYNVHMAQAAYYPSISGSAGYEWVSPKESITLDHMTFSMNAHNNYNASVALRQLIYGFGQYKPRVDAAKAKQHIAQYQKEQVYQSLSMNTISIYYNICFMRQALVIKNEELKDHDEMLRQMELLTLSGSNTNFDLLNTKVSRHVVVSHMTGLEASLNSLQVQLSELVDSTITTAILLDNKFEYQKNIPPLEELLQMAYTYRREMIIADKEIEIAQYEIKSAKRAYNPTLELAANAGGKNGYLMDLDRMRFFYNAGVTLSIPIFDGNRRHQSLNIAKSGHNSAIYQRELIVKEITNDVSGVYYNLISDMDKAEQFAMQVILAEEAYKQAVINYRAGSITNLELLTSSTNLSNSKLLLLQAKIGCIVDLYKLSVSIGKPIWKDTESIVEPNSLETTNN